MKENNTPKTIRLSEYQAPNYLIDTVHLDVRIYEHYTDVISHLAVRANPDVPTASGQPLELVGVELELLGIEQDGATLALDHFRIDGEVLTIKDVPDQFTLLIMTRIHPKQNTSLEGLYVSKGMYCTQCEAEGFRKITYYLDRPDVMSRFTTRVEAPKQAYPVLLSNGNPVERGDLDDGRHYVIWEDPFKKPCYLFALVAGDLSVVEDHFTTSSGRDVLLQLYVEPHDLDKCEHAMDSLKRSMAWDEEVYGREYDLDIYMIVAVSHFNMGAMENKGLNIFNTSCVLANAKTTTDMGFQRVESVIAHEYFHNWSGNRVTCRDWFQLSLKEGFTVFRDQQFSADMGSETVNRIDDVNMLKTVQFAEDSGPMSHPVRPDSYIEINNFYTTTVYEKGAEVVRMIHRLMGKDGFRKGSDLYFERHDGQAVTCDDFVQAMEDANGVDLTLFRRWYSQAGTPHLKVTSEYVSDQNQFSITFEQTTLPTPGQPEKLPLHIPVAIGLLGADGKDLALQLSDGTVLDPLNPVLELKQAKQTFRFNGIKEQPVASVLRGFSAPVKLFYEQERAELAFLMSHDSDGFNRWNASQRLTVEVLLDLMSAYQEQKPLYVDSLLLESFRALLADESLDQAMVAKMLELPTEQFLAELLPKPVQVDAIHHAREGLKRELACGLRQELQQVINRCHMDPEYHYNVDAVAKRSLRNVCLAYVMTLADDEATELCLSQYREAGNMTDQLAAFRALAHSERSEKTQVIADFYQQWSSEALVVDQWFMVQASSPQPDALDNVQALMQHEAFEMTSPNKIRALIGAFCNNNPVNFHRLDGAGYAFLADQIIALNNINPQVASRMSTILTRWANYDRVRADLIKAQLTRIKAEKLSPDVYEIVSKALNQ
ncbi:aminopeptidase N [Ketobacter alkanivorans]|uniref:Aminopeptidase N n=1 Tax=Ketobacter alkanivorans TaxID=1917421 RepID=A0A2K9LGM0_9GAMM|nr:aminopeptidase N [Ketobacter alkanivorans]AUM11499.1 aminopeptidase N [Ketobacter alkanivorans]